MSKHISSIGTVIDHSQESGTNFHRVPMVDVDGAPINILELIEQEMGQYSCRCSHDCCGHKFFSRAQIVGIYHDHYILAQDWGINV